MRTFEIIDNTPEAINFMAYAKTLPFVREKRTKKSENATPPCQYTVEELRERVAKAEEDIAAGRTIPHEEVMKPYLKWL